MASCKIKGYRYAGALARSYLKAPSHPGFYWLAMNHGKGNGYKPAMA